MGGEKLKSSRPELGGFFIIVFIITGLLGISFPLSAQAGEPAQGTGTTVSGNAAGNAAEAPVSLPDESAMILGETPAVPAPVSSSSVFVMLRMILVLALAALAIYGVVFFIKRLARPQENRDPHLKVLARVSLGNDSYAAVVSVGARAWLVGGASGGVSLISEIDDPEALETMLLDDARRAAETPGRRFLDFRSLLPKPGRSTGDGKGNQPDSSHAEDGSLAESLRKQRERLKGL